MNDSDMKTQDEFTKFQKPILTELELTNKIREIIDDLDNDGYDWFVDEKLRSTDKSPEVYVKLLNILNGESKEKTELKAILIDKIIHQKCIILGITDGSPKQRMDAVKDFYELISKLLMIGVIVKKPQDSKKIKDLEIRINQLGNELSDLKISVDNMARDIQV